MDNNGQNDNQNASPKDKKKSLSKTQLILIAVVILLIGVTSVMGMVLYKTLKQPPPIVASDPVSAHIVTSDNVEAIGNILKEEVKEGMFEINMNAQWTFESSKKPSKDAYIVNSPNNHRPINIELSLNDTGEVIYTSPIMPIGTGLKTVTLQKELPQGTYPTTCTYNLLNEDNSIKTSFTVAVIITIEK